MTLKQADRFESDVEAQYTPVHMVQFLSDAKEFEIEERWLVYENRKPRSILHRRN